MSSALYSTGCLNGASSLSLLQTTSSRSTSHGCLARQAQPHGRRVKAEVRRVGSSLKLARLDSCPRGFSFASNGIFNPLRLPSIKSGAPPTRFERRSFGQVRASSSELSFQEGYARRRGRSIEQPAPSTSGRSGLSSSNLSRSASLGLFVERTKDAVHWSFKKPRPRATVIEKKLKRSLTGDRQREANRLTQAPGVLFFLRNHFCMNFIYLGIFPHVF